MNSIRSVSKIPSFPRKREPRVASVRAVALGPRFRGGDDYFLKLAATFWVGPFRFLDPLLPTQACIPGKWRQYLSSPRKRGPRAANRGMIQKRPCVYILASR